MSKTQKVYCDNCGTGLVSTFIKCPSCGGREFSEKPTSSPPIENRTINFGRKNRSLVGLGGWLILVGIGVVLGPIKLLGLTIIEFSNAFSEGTLEAITTPGTESYVPLVGPYIICELIVTAGLFIALLYLVFLFFSKKLEFPKWYIRILALSLFLSIRTL